MKWVLPRAVKQAALAALLLLGGATWWATGLWQDYETKSEVDRTSQEADLRLAGFVSDFERSLAYIRSVPVVVANAPVVRQAVSGRGSDLPALNEYLAFIAKTLNVDLAFVVDSSGLCIASSNYAQASTLVGEHFADREQVQGGSANALHDIWEILAHPRLHLRMLVLRWLQVHDTRPDQ